MLNKSLISIALLALTTVACENSEFAGATGATQAYSVSVKDGLPGADSSAETVKDGESTTTDESKSEKGKGKVKEPIKGEDGSEQADCAKLSGVKLENVKVSGSLNNIVITKQDALAFKVTGNQNLVTVDLKNQPAESLVKAICIFVAGNQNQIKLEIGNHVGAIYVIARGNQPQINISALKGSVIDTIEMDAKGNGGKLSVSGEGKFPCDKTNAGISCQ